MNKTKQNTTQWDQELTFKKNFKNPLPFCDINLNKTQTNLFLLTKGLTLKHSLHLRAYSEVNFRNRISNKPRRT